MSLVIVNKVGLKEYCDYLTFKHAKKIHQVMQAIEKITCQPSTISCRHKLACQSNNTCNFYIFCSHIVFRKCKSNFLKVVTSIVDN